MEACTGCGKSLALGDVLYNGDGQIICVDCNSKADIAGDEKKSANNILRASITCLVAALLGFGAFMVAFGLGFWAGAIVSLGAGFFAVSSMLTNGERFTRNLSAAQKTIVWVCSISGLAIAAYETLAIFGIIRFHFYLS